MRISDWSSDVCSSDLDMREIVVAAIDRTGREAIGLLDRRLHAVGPARMAGEQVHGAILPRLTGQLRFKSAVVGSALQEGGLRIGAVSDPADQQPAAQVGLELGFAPMARPQGAPGGSATMHGRSRCT